MNHEEIIKKGIIEKYLMQQLSGEDETVFEEHLLYCAKCRTELQKTEKIISGIEDHMHHKSFSEGRSQNAGTTGKSAKLFHYPRKILRIAAGIIFLIGAAGILYLYFSKPLEKTIVADKEISNEEIKIIDDMAGKDSQIIEEKPEKDRQESKSQQSNEILLAENYQPNPFYENMVKSVLRAGAFALIEPKDSIVIQSGQKLSFIWQTEQEIELIILTNNGVVIKEQSGNSPIEFYGFRKSGLYYWKLDTKEETVAAGKIYVN